jgi:hypothetical protein
VNSPVNVTVSGTDKDLADPAAWQPRESWWPQNLQILKYVAASFGLDSILLTFVAILVPCQQETEIISLITAAPPPPPHRVIHATGSSAVRYRQIRIK